MTPRSLLQRLARFLKDQAMPPTTAVVSANAGSAGGSRRRAVAARAAAVLTTLAALGMAALSLSAAPALADDCPNAALRAQNNSTQLPDCRAYELVSPVFKQGLPPAPNGFSDDGRVAYASNGNFADNGNGYAGIIGGNQYVADRSASGWSTTALTPSGPDYEVSSPNNPSLAAVFSSDLRSSLWLMRRGDQPTAVSDLYLRRPDDVFTRVGSPATGSFNTSDDLSHIAFSNGDGTFEYDGTGDGGPRPVSVDNVGQRVAPGCPTPVGSPNDGSTYHAISSNGHVIFFTSGCAAPAVYARVGGTTTIKASTSLCARAPSDPGGACNADSAPVFQGANADGTRVYFTTSQQLVNGDTDASNDLYECDIPAGTPAPVGAVNSCPDLHEVSGAAAGADVQGITRISDDGSRAYFVATGVLAFNPGANDAAAVAGDDNLYVWHRDAAHPTGETRFVAKLDPADGAAPGLWNPDTAGRLAQATDDGRYLVFVTDAALIDHGPQADTDTARDVYRYDAELGALTRLSTDADGAGGNELGHDAQFIPIAYFPNTPTTHRPRGAMTDDGGSVVFNTDEGLSPDDTNGTVDTYLWQEGRVSLISSGKQSEDSIPGAGGVLGTSSFTTRIQAYITPSGRDVYFTTSAPLTPKDVDTVVDIYDARIDGGFDQTPPPACVGESCRGGRSSPPSPPQPVSASSRAQDEQPQTTPAFTVGKLTASQLRRVVSTGKVSLSVVTNMPGTLSATATATIAKRSSSVGSAKRRVAKAGTVSLSLTLSKKARAELKSKRKLTVKVLVSQDNVAIARTVSLKLTQSKATKKKAKKTSSRTTSRHAAAKVGRS